MENYVSVVDFRDVRIPKFWVRVTASVRGFWPKIRDASVVVRNTIHCIRCQVSIRVRHVHCPNLI